MSPHNHGKPAGTDSAAALGSISAQCVDPKRDGIVSGTAGADLINLSYTGDPDGDRIDHNDALLPGAVGNEDFVMAGDGDDTVLAGQADDFVAGGTGNDEIHGECGDDYLGGEEGNDTLYGGTGNDTIYGDAGNDLIFGEDGNDLVFGGDGNDTIFGGAGNDWLKGNAGEDQVFGGAGDDSLRGDDGADTVEGGTGNDSIEGGAGANLLIGNAGDDKIIGGDDGNVIYGDDMPVPATAAAFAAAIPGSSNNDTLIGGAGNDLIFGGGGQDWIEGRQGADTLYGGDGDDTVLGQQGHDSIFGDAGQDSLVGDAGDDYMDGGTGDDRVFGGSGNDSMFGRDGQDFMEGKSGNDTLIGGLGVDTMHGDEDRDVFIVNSFQEGNHDVVDGGTGGDDFDVLDLSGAGPWRIVNETVDPDGDSTSGTVEFLDGTGGVRGSMTFTEIEKCICFTPGTLIATPRGEVAVEDLREGDRIITRDNGIQELRWIGRKTLDWKDLAANSHLKPILIRQGSLGNGLPERDMMVSPNHRILVANERTALYFEEHEVLVAAKHLIDNKGIRQVDSLGTTYIHFMFDQHEVVLSNGAWAESFQPGDQSLNGLGNAQRQEIFELFPDLKTPVGIESYSAARRTLKKHEAVLLSR